MIDKVRLGNTGLEASRLSIGTGTHGVFGRSSQTRKLGTELPDLLQYAYDRGINWFDTADQYGSHKSVGQAAHRIGRDKVIITSKTIAQTAAWARKDLDRFRRELNTDYIDIVLMHCMLHRWWNRVLRPVMDVLSEAQQKGIVRAVGVSNHDLGALRTTVQEPWVQIVLARYNPLGQSMEAAPEVVLPLLQQMHADGKAIYGMKVMAVGAMRGRTREAMRFQLDAGCMDAFTIGMESRAEVDENVDTLEQLLHPAVPA
jgi:aryl-alcohol dehydrogenase-like predicted oxidoreductase